MFSSRLIYLTLILYCHSGIFATVLPEGELDIEPWDPLKIGQIEPTSLEVASTYVFIVPFVIFVFGILFIPVSLVILFLFVTPFLVPNGNPEGRRSISHQIQLLPQGLFPSLSKPQQHLQETQSNYDTLVNNILSAIQSHGQWL